MLPPVPVIVDIFNSLESAISIGLWSWFISRMWFHRNCACESCPLFSMHIGSTHKFTGDR